MKFIEQPDSYSDILVRIFTSSLMTGVACTIVLCIVSPDIKQFIESIPGQSDIGPFKGLATSYVLIPFIISLFSRAIKLHDKISNILRIRQKFDVEHILFNIVRGVGMDINGTLKAFLKLKHQEVMYKVFYEYAGFNEPKIDRQLVRSALDSWGWFWAALESSMILLITLVILFVYKKWYLFTIGIIFMISLVCLLFFHWFECRTYALREVKAILSDDTRKREIKKYLTTLAT